MAYWGEYIDVLQASLIKFLSIHNFFIRFSYLYEIAYILSVL